MDPYTILFYSVLGTVMVIVAIAQLIGWRKEKGQRNRIKITSKHSLKTEPTL